MIGCEISGGLGNQFFRYAFSRYLQIKRKSIGISDELIINFNYTDKHGFDGDLSDFRIAPHRKIYCRRTLIEEGTLLQKFVYALVTRICSILRKLLKKDLFTKIKAKILGSFGIIISENPDNERLYINERGDRLFPIGSFENEKYFHDIRNLLCDEFTPQHEELPENKELYDIIRSRNSVCLSVRRGDFMKDENKKTFYVCDLTYFQKAIDYIQKQVENPTFIVFSNDIQWVKDNLQIEGDVYYESGNDPVWETYRLMYSCKHFIISNSTLHWWAQYKGDYENKIVVAPDRWYNAPGWENHLMLDYFVRINTGVPNPFYL